MSNGSAVQAADHHCRVELGAKRFKNEVPAAVRHRHCMTVSFQMFLNCRCQTKLRDVCILPREPRNPGQGATSKCPAGGAAAAAEAPAGTESLITVQDVSKSHDGLRVLFSDLTFTIRRGDRMAIIGANGSGKPFHLYQC